MTRDDASLLRLIAAMLRLDIAQRFPAEVRAELADFLDRVAGGGEIPTGPVCVNCQGKRARPGQILTRTAVGYQCEDCRRDRVAPPNLGSIAEHDHRERGGSWIG